jgi:hypothetical protein
MVHTGIQFTVYGMITIKTAPILAYLGLQAPGCKPEAVYARRLAALS